MNSSPYENNNFIDGDVVDSTVYYIDILSNEGPLAPAVESTDGGKPTHRDFVKIAYAGSGVILLLWLVHL